MRALYRVGMMYLTGEGLVQDLRKAEAFLRRSARQEHRPAILALAELYAKGDGVQPDLREAAHWYQRAADLGVAQAPLPIIGAQCDFDVSIL